MEFLSSSVQPEYPIAHHIAIGRQRVHVQLNCTQFETSNAINDLTLGVRAKKPFFQFFRCLVHAIITKGCVNERYPEI